MGLARCFILMGMYMRASGFKMLGREMGKWYMLMEIGMWESGEIISLLEKVLITLESK